MVLSSTLELLGSMEKSGASPTKVQGATATFVGPSWEWAYFEINLQ